MSNYLAIATVTETIAQIVRDAVYAVPGVSGATVTTLRPERAKDAGARVNVYLYQVTPNAALRNADLPTRRADGTLDQRPRTALDLHYLISFYGKEERLEPQQLMGITVTALSAQPILTRGEILKAVEAAPESYLRGADLADQVEQVRFSPVPLNLEELSKLWSVMFQVPHALSVAYQGAVVLLDANVPIQPSLPVRSSGSSAAPFAQPVVDEVASDAGPRTPVVAGGTMVIRGRRLAGAGNTVRIGEAVLTPALADMSETWIRVPLTGDWVRAGVWGVQVVQASGAASNAAAVVLRPVVGTMTLGAGDLAVGVTPPVRGLQRAVLLLNEFNPPSGRPARAYSVEAPRGEEGTATDTLTFSLADVAPGEYLVRVQVDGAESLLAVDTDPASPTAGMYASPRMTVP